MRAKTKTTYSPEQIATIRQAVSDASGSWALKFEAAKAAGFLGANKKAIENFMARTKPAKGKILTPGYDVSPEPRKPSASFQFVNGKTLKRKRRGRPKGSKNKRKPARAAATPSGSLPRSIAAICARFSADIQAAAIAHAVDAVTRTIRGIANAR